jgi:hypothetical protein
MGARWQVLLKSKWTKWVVGAGVLVKVGLLVVGAMGMMGQG